MGVEEKRRSFCVPHGPARWRAVTAKDRWMHVPPAEGDGEFDVMWNTRRWCAHPACCYPLDDLVTTTHSRQVCSLAFYPFYVADIPLVLLSHVYVPPQCVVRQF